MIYEDRHTKPISTRRFARRMTGHVAVAAALIGASLLGGMGPVDAPHSNGGKLFAGFFALYAGGVFLVVAGLFLTPVLHRLMHVFHWDGELG